MGESTAHWLAVNYRDAHGLFACNGILFSHESALRPARSGTRKVTQDSVRIARGATTSKANVHLGWKANLTKHDMARVMVQHELDASLPL